MSDLVRFVNSNGMISSKVVAERFKKQHKNVLRTIAEAKKEMSNDFYWLNFEPVDIAGKSSEIMMTRDGFSMIAMGFTGARATKWKERFLEAFNQMEQTIKDEVPRLRDRIAYLESERRLLPKNKKQHGKGLVWVPVAKDTLFGRELEYRKAPKSDPRFSDESRMEGELNRLSRMSEGMQRRIRELADVLALRRRT